MEQKMAPLTESRLASDLPCLYNMGCDYFGHFIVANSWKVEERFGVLFTPTTSRAILIEMSYDTYVYQILITNFRGESMIFLCAYVIY